jgi:hypothetical protein
VTRAGRRPIHDGPVVAVAARLPADLAAWVRERAAAEGRSVAGWLERMLVAERERVERGGRRAKP